jgi:hypothetical protein
MSIYELHYLMLEVNGLMYGTVEIWLTVSFAVLLAGYYIGSEIGKKLRRIVSGAYVIWSTVTIFDWFQHLYSVAKYQEEINRLGGMEFPKMLALGATGALLLSFMLIAGSIICTHYFLTSTKEKDEN